MNPDWLSTLFRRTNPTLSTSAGIASNSAWSFEHDVTAIPRITTATKGIKNDLIAAALKNFIFINIAGVVHQRNYIFRAL